MQRFLTAVTNHTADLGVPLTTEFQGYFDAYKSARSAQLNKIGEVAETKTGSTEKKDAVEIELHKNLHTIAAMYPGDVDRCMDFFDSFIKDTVTTPEEEEQPTP